MPPRLLLLIALAFLVACGDDEGEPSASAQAPPLEGTPWLVASGLTAPDSGPVVVPSVTFADGKASGFAGCNRFTAPYELDGDKLKLGLIAMTNMACEPDVTAVEQEFGETLEAVAAFKMEGDELVLLDTNGDERMRLRESSPAGSWTVTAFRHPDSVSSPLPGTEITAEFGADGTLSGSAGCNTYSTTYTLDGGKLRIAKPAATEKACAEPAGVMEQEQQFLSVLPSTATYELNSTGLTLLKADGTIVANLARAS